MTERRETSRRMERKTGLNDAPVDHLARQTRYESELISTSLEKYIVGGAQEHSLYDEGVKILEQERIRRGPLDPYPTTTLCRQLGKIISLTPSNAAAVKTFKDSLNYGLEHFRDDEKFSKILKDSFVRNFQLKISHTIEEKK